MVAENSVNMGLVANCAFVITYLLLIWERVPKVVAALLGASAVMMLGVLDQKEAFAAIDFNVIALLVGMMILINILKQTGAVEWLAITAAKNSKGNGALMMLSLALMTAVLSAFLDNVTTIIVMASVTCSLTRQLGISPIPYLMTEVIASNIGGTATLIGDPPNILIGSAAGLSFNAFLVHLSPVVGVILLVSLGTLYLMYRNELYLSPEKQAAIEALPLTGVIQDRRLMIQSLVVIGLVFVGFLCHHAIHQEVGTIALAGASILLAFENRKAIWDDVEWTTIFFFIGLFIVIGAVEKVGTLDFLANWFIEVTRGDFKITTIGLLWLSGILSAIIDNIPYTATMIPVIRDMEGLFSDIAPLWWSLALGACLGGNGTLIGATANVIMVDYAHREGHPIGFIEFFKVGSIITLLSLVICTGYVWLRYLA